MTTIVEALRGLLEDIEDYQRLNNLGGENNHWQVIARAVLAEHDAQQEPVAWIESPYGAIRANPKYRWEKGPTTVTYSVPLYAHPAAPQQKPVAWPAELSSDQRTTRQQRFNVTPALSIDDDDFIFDALIEVTGDFPAGMKEKYVAEIARRLNTHPSQDAEPALKPRPIKLLYCCKCGKVKTDAVMGPCDECGNAEFVSLEVREWGTAI